MPCNRGGVVSPGSREMARCSPCVLLQNQPLPPSRDFQDGRWFNNTMTVKDRWVQEYYETIVAYRLQIEGDKDLQKQGEKIAQYVAMNRNKSNFLTLCASETRSVCGFIQ